MPPPARWSTVLPARSALNPPIDPSAGGNPTLLRDGGANGAAYVHNTGGASYSELLIAYGDRLDAPMTFDPAAGICIVQRLRLCRQRDRLVREACASRPTTAADTKEALAARTAEALSNDTGVNVDMEMSLLLDLEHTYQASARMMKTVDDMLDALLRGGGISHESDLRFLGRHLAMPCAIRRCACRPIWSRRRRKSTTGKVADVGLTLGGRTSQSVTFSRDLDRLNGIVDSNALVAARLTSTQDFARPALRRRAELPLGADQLPYPAIPDSVTQSPARRAAAADLDPQHQRERRISVRRHQHRRQADQRLSRRLAHRPRPPSTPPSSPISASARTTRPRPTSPPPRWTIS